MALSNRPPNRLARADDVWRLIVTRRRHAVELVMIPVKGWLTSCATNAVRRSHSALISRSVTLLVTFAPFAIVC